MFIFKNLVVYIYVTDISIKTNKKILHPIIILKVYNMYINNTVCLNIFHLYLTSNNLQ